MRAHKAIPGPRGYPLLGVLPELRRDPLAAFERAARDYGDVVRLPVGPIRVFLLNHPDHVKRVVQDNHRNYRLPRFYKRLRPVFGDGVFTSEGTRWSRQRRVLQPAFDVHRIEALVPVIGAVTERKLERWTLLAGRGKPLDIAHEAACLTLDVIARALLGTDLGERVDDASRAIRVLLETVVRRTTDFTGLGERLPTRRNRRFRHALRVMDEIVHGIIEERRRERERKRDLLTLLLEADNRDGGTNAARLRDEVTTMLVSGNVTTGNALTWTWYLVARHPEVERRLQAEVAAAWGGRAPAVEDLAKLGYTRMVVQEALRLFPPTWRLARTAIESDEFDGHRVPAGAIVVFSPYLIHRHPGFWDDPETFDPERFALERAGERPRFAYIPFGGGPRACLGQQFAMLEMQVIVAMVGRRFRLRLASDEPVELEPVVTLRPRHGLMATLEQHPAPT